MGLYEEGVRTSIFHQKELLVSPLNEHLLCAQFFTFITSLILPIAWQCE